ncbi:MAG: transporter substrate-binding domain-containing protein [Aequorivita sp.]
MRNFHILFILLLLINPSSFAQEGDRDLRVGYAGSAPFVMPNEKEEGIVIDIWKEIAYGLRENFSLVKYQSVESGIDAIEKNQIDILIGPITINSSRANLASFSQPYYNTELAILAPVVETTVWDRVKPFLSTTFLYAVIGLLIILTFVGFLFWLVEGRKSEDDYGKGVIRGTGSGIWLAVVTMTTVGYGDYAPRTPGGRFIMGMWMVISLILATSFVAGIATTFSQSSKEDKTITSLSHLENKKVAVPNYKKIMDKVRDAQGIPVAVNDVSEGYQMLLDKKVDALIYDEIPLEYIFEDSKRKEFVLSKKRIEPQYYGFLFPIGSKLKRKVDLQIIRLQESQEITHIVEDWISRN